MSTKFRDSVIAGAPRRQIGMTRDSVSGIYLFRGEDPIAFESTLERDFLVRMEADRTVLSIVSQPVTLEYTDRGRRRRYTPDFMVYRRQLGCSGVAGQYCPNELIEVKPADVLARDFPRFKARFRAAIRWCRLEGHVFRIMHENRIRDVMWRNTCFLARYRKMDPDPKVTARIVDTLGAMGATTFQNTVNQHFFDYRSRAEGIAHLWHLVATGVIDCDLTQPLSNSTEIWVRDDEW